VLIDELRSEDISVRLRSLGQIELIAQALGHARSREELLPFIMDMCDDDDEVLTLIATKLGNMVEYIGGNDYAFYLLRPLEQLVTVEEQVIRDSAIQSLNQVVSAMDNDGLVRHFKPFVTRLLGGDWYISRISGCLLAVRLLIRSFDIDLYRQVGELTREDTPKVRRASFAALAALSPILPLDLCESHCAILEKTSRDEEDSVRTGSIEVVYSLLCIYEEALTRTYIPYLTRIIDTATDDPSWRVRNSVVEYSERCLKACKDEVFSGTLCRSLVKLIKDPDAEVRAAAVGSLSRCLSNIQNDQLKLDILQNLECISRDTSETVRLSFASSFCTMDSCQSDLFIQFCLPAMLQLCRDDSMNVRLRALGAVNRVPQFIPVHMFRLAILPSLRDIVADKNWRTRNGILAILPDILNSDSSNGSEDEILTWLEKFLTDTVYSVREATGFCMAAVFRTEQVKLSVEKVVGVIQNVMGTANYLYRITALLAAKQVLLLQESEVNITAVFKIVESSAADSVVNVRLTFLRIARELASHKSLHDRLKALVRALEGDINADVRSNAKMFWNIK